MRRRALMSKTKDPFEGYTKLEYIEDNATTKGWCEISSIKVNQNLNYRYNCTVQLCPPSNSLSYYVSLIDDSLSPNLYYDRIGFSTSRVTYYVTYSPYNKKLTFTYYRGSDNKGRVVYNGTTKASQSSSSGTTTMRIPCFRSRILTTIKIYQIEITENGKVVHDFYPVRRVSDSVLGFLDIIDNVFYPPYGGSFIAGPNA